jgi:ubiquitin-protein ligase/DNA-directed RNA polymerase subunit RPC12/RpoP
MISFTCAGCGRSFSVPDTFAGRRATCKNCGAPIVVPEAAAPPTPQVRPADPLQASGDVPGTNGGGAARPLPVPPRIPLRIRRLISDAKQMSEAFANFPLIKVHHSAGNPPEEYQVEYFIKGLEHGKGGKPVPRDTHRVEIKLTADYPRVGPHCKMLTPIFHPNIDPATICIGDHWAAGERLASLVVRIGEMIAYQAYNIQSPLDAEAAMWADLNGDKLPIDKRNLHPAEL